MCLKSLCFCELYFVHYPSYRANVSLVSLISLVTGQILCIGLVRSSLLGLGMKQKMIEAFVLNMDNLRLQRPTGMWNKYLYNFSLLQSSWSIHELSFCGNPKGERSSKHQRSH